MAYAANASSFTAVSPVGRVAGSSIAVIRHRVFYGRVIVLVFNGNMYLW